MISKTNYTFVTCFVDLFACFIPNVSIDVQTVHGERDTLLLPLTVRK